MSNPQTQKKKDRLCHKIKSIQNNVESAIESRMQLSYHLGKKYLQFYGKDMEIADLMVKSCFWLNFFDKTIEFVDYIMTSTPSKKPEDHTLTLLIYKAKSLNRLNKIEEYNEYYDKLKIQCSGLKSWKDKDSDLQNYLSQQQKQPSKNIKCEKNWKLIKETQINRDNDPFYIISTKFLRKWKNYVGFKEFIKDDNAIIDEDEKNFMEEEDVENLLPPSLSQEDILLQDEVFLPDSADFVGNTPIKPDLVENKDFIIVSEEAADSLHKEFGGVRIKRNSFLGDDILPKVEIGLKEINFFVIPDVLTLNLEKPQKIYISKRKKVKSLSDKLFRTMDLFIFLEELPIGKMEKRLWKLQNDVDFMTLKKSLSDKPVKFQGKLLSEDTLIDDAEIGETDILILEIKLKGWTFIVPEDVNGKKNTPQTNSNNSMVRNVSINDKIRYFDLHVNCKYNSDSKKGLTGLQNLGNTCFMNSGLQCLSNTYQLTDYLIKDEFIKDINMDNPIGTKGHLVAAYSELIKEMWTGRNMYVSPWNLKKVIGKFANQFYGYSQQDSQELLSYLLDGLHEDLNKIMKKPILETIESGNRKEEEVAALSWENHLKRNDSAIVDLFHGQFKSTLFCPDCKKISITFDPFNMVSLPIPNIEYQKIYFYFIFKDPLQQPFKLTLNLPTSTTVEEILSKIASILKKRETSLCMFLLKEHKIQEQVTSEKTVTYIHNHPGLPFVFEIYPELSPSVVKSEEMEIADEGKGKLGLVKQEEARMTQEEANNKLLEPEIIKQEDTAQMKNEIVKQEEEASRIIKYVPQSLESKKQLTKPLLVKIQVLQESKAFYDSEKNISYNRILYLENDLSFEEFHHMIYLKFRQNIANYISKDSTKMSIERDLKNQAYDVIEQEYKNLFPEEKENDLIYRVIVLNQNIQNSSKKPCDLCDKRGCKGCRLPCDRNRFLSLIINKWTIDGKEMVVEIKFSKTIKIDNMGMNRCQDYVTDDPNENKGQSSNSIYDCLSLFTRAEKLEKENAWYCNHCKEHKQATKTMAIYKEPKYLILHLKRFKASKVNMFYSSNSKKITSFVSFPLNGLDLTEYIKGNKENKKIIYDLFAVSNHYGGLSGGHYTAYGKNHFSKKWYDFNDSRVIEASQSEIVSSGAYLLFYKKSEE